MSEQQSTQHTPEQWPVRDCLGRLVPHLSPSAQAGTDLVCQGRTFRDGKWLPWEPISATVYENRKLWPRNGYEVRIAKASPPAVQPACN